MSNNAVVLLSGGLDSTTTLALVKSQGFTPHALSIFYGQRNQVELEAAKKVAKYFEISNHKILELDLRIFGGSALTSDLDVKSHKTTSTKAIPNTYVPARNTIMLSLALAYAEVTNSDHIFYGANIHDYSGYPDCRPEYVKAFENMANLSTKRAVEGQRVNIKAPLMDMTKAQIIKLGISLGINYKMTHSCYAPKNNLACGQCSACFYRKEGFIKAQIPDPTEYGYI